MQPRDVIRNKSIRRSVGLQAFEDYDTDRDPLKIPFSTVSALTRPGLCPAWNLTDHDNSRMSGRCSDSSHALITVVRTLPNELSVIANFAIASSLGVSEMSSQNIPLKGCTDFRESSRIPATETVRV
jgi:hypothetical protein